MFVFNLIYEDSTEKRTVCVLRATLSRAEVPSLTPVNIASTRVVKSVRGGLKSHLMEDKSVLAQFIGNKIVFSRFTRKSNVNFRPKRTYLMIF